MYHGDSISKKFISIKFFFFLVIFFLKGLHFSCAQIPVNSVLKKGDWWQFSVDKKGMYKITGKMLKDAGMNLSLILPSNIKCYKNDGGPKPQSLNAEKIDDLKEMAIHVVSTHNQMQETDYIIFFASGPHQVQFDETHQQYLGFKNIYSDYSYIYINPYDTSKGLRIKPYLSPVTAIRDFTSFDEYQYVENDESKLLFSGREWLGKAIEKQKEFLFETATLSGDKLKMHINAASAYNYDASSRFDFFINEVNIGSQNFPSISSLTSLNREYAMLGIKKISNFEMDINPLIQNNSIVLKCIFSSSNNTQSRGYIDRLSLNYHCELEYPSNGFLLFRSIESRQNDRAKFIFKNRRNEHEVWLVTDSYNPQRILITEDDQEDSFNFYSHNIIQEFVVFKNDLLTPKFVQKVQNQDLHALKPVQLLIITPRKFISLAHQWKNWRERNNGLTAHVVDTESIYHEFGGGAQDVVAIRDFVKLIYDKGRQTNSQSLLQSLLLIGDASYDYLSQEGSNTNQLPIYESRNSLDPLRSYSSDDFYGLLASHEGEWAENAADQSTLDIGIGRIPINTLEEGQQVLDKIKYYETSPNTLGDWRNKIILVADDEDRGLHMKDTEIMSKTIDDNTADFFVNKMYLDDYKQVSTGARETSTDFQKALHAAFDEGALIFNYSGHGREDLLAEENILDSKYIQSMSNINQLPLFVIATCQFGRIDNPHLATGYSGAEKALLNPSGGAIALFSTGRPVYAFSNQKINKAFYEYVFDKKNGQYMTLGEIFKHTKNNSILGVNNRNFMLIGDPSMTLNYPKKRVKIVQIQGQSIHDSYSIHPLQKTKITGEVLKDDGTKNESFDGQIDIILFDHPQSTSTLGYQQASFHYKKLNSIIFKGKATVTSGNFNFSFFPPKTIDFSQIEKLKMITYAVDNVNRLDANGSNINLLLGNTRATTIDDTPPEISLTIKKKAGAYFLISNFSDDSGINLTSNGITNGIQLTVNKDKSQSLIPYYIPVIDDTTRGQIQWSTEHLPEGEHTFTVIVRDTWNNSSTKTISFFAGKQERLINRMVAYPNPATVNHHLNFIIYHNGYDELLDLEIRIFNTFGDIVYSNSLYISNNQGIIDEIRWIPHPKYSSGQYFYHLRLYSRNTGVRDQIQGKILLR